MSKILTEEDTILTEELEDEADLEDLFDEDDDLDLDDQDDETEDEAEETEGDPAEEQPAAAEGTFRIKYNGEEKDIPLDEARALVQKGYNYDKVAGERDELKKSGAPEALELVRNLAEENGMEVADYIVFASKNLSQASVNAQMRQLEKEHPDWPKDVIKELAESRAAKKAAQVQADRTAKEQAVWDELAAEYPDLKTADDLPQEVREMIQSGKTPLMAMRTHENAQLKKQIEELKRESQTKEQNEKNRRASVGTVTGQEKPKIDEIDRILRAIE